MSPSWPRLEKRPMVTCENGYGNGQLVCHSRHGWSWHAGSSRSGMMYEKLEKIMHEEARKMFERKR